MKIIIEKKLSKKMTYFQLNVGKLRFSIGYYSGDLFYLFDLKLLEMSDDIYSDLIVIFGLSIAKCSISLSYYKNY